MEINNCIVLLGQELDPYYCSKFEVVDGVVARVDIIEKAEDCSRSSRVIIPGLWNGHTHIGDSCLPDGASGMTVEEAFFRPNGYKYQQLNGMSEEVLLDAMVGYHRYMAESGSVGHIDFREQGEKGAAILRRASKETRVKSIILSQFQESPFSKDELVQNEKGLSTEFLNQLEGILKISDGFSESTMNDLTDVAWEAIREFSSAQKKIRAIHCLESESYRNTSLKITGKGDLERALTFYDPHLIIHMTIANAQEIARVSESNASVVLNPRANANLGLPLPRIDKLLDSGVNLLLGTDNGMLNSPNLFAEMDFTYKICKSQYEDPSKLNPVEILKMCTSNMGKFMPEIPGSLGKGMPADFAIIDFSKSHLKLTRNIVASIVTRVTPGDILETYKDGVSIFSRNRDE